MRRREAGGRRQLGLGNAREASAIAAMLLLFLLGTGSAAASEWLHDPLLARTGEGALFPDRVDFDWKHESGRLRTDFEFDRDYLDDDTRALVGGRDRNRPGASRAVRRRYRAVGRLDLLSGLPLVADRSASLALVGSYEASDEWMRVPTDELASPVRREGRQAPSIGLNLNLGGVDLGFEQRFAFGSDEENGLREEQLQGWKLSAYVPLADLLGKLAPYWLVPSVTYNLSNTDTHLSGWRRDGLRRVALERSSLMHFVGADWAGETWSLSYAHLTLDQSELVGGYASEYRYASHDATFSTWLIEDVTIFLWGSRMAEGYGYDGSDSHRVDSASLGFTWNFQPRWALSTSFSPAWESDRASRSNTEMATVSAELEWRFADVPGGKADESSRLRLRIARSDSLYRDDWGSRVGGEEWIVGVGLVIPVF